MSAWVLLTIAGAFLQNLRSLRRQLTEELSLSGAAYVRFLFMPFAWFSWRFYLSSLYCRAKPGLGVLAVCAVRGRHPNHRDIRLGRSGECSHFALSTT